MTKTFRALASLAVVATLVASATGCDGRARRSAGGSTKAPPPRRGPKLAVVDLAAGVPELPAPGFLGLPSRQESYADLVFALEALKKDAEAKAVFVRFGTVEFGLARALEIGRILEELRGSGKKVVCHGEAFSNATYAAAARGCGTIAVSPAGEVEAVGLAAQVVYMRKLLVDELRLDIDILQVGKFKGAEEPLTRDGPSDEARASLVGTLGGIRASWVEAITKGRDGKVDENACEDGPYPPESAKARGIVDAVGYADDVREETKKSNALVREDVVYGGSGPDDDGDLADLVRMLGGGGKSSAPVALVRAVGSIAMTGGRGPMGDGAGILERRLGRVLARLEEDDDVRAVVLRIDSPGGSALASDLLWHRLMRIRAKKPIVVSVGEMAASGGYYLASTGNVIFAESGSILGSMGVVGGKIGVARALERFGVHAETFAASPKGAPAAARAGYNSPLAAWDEATRGKAFDHMKATYDLFLARVAEGRKLPVEKIAESAEGRIFGGVDAKARGLVDELGGLVAAIAKAKELAKLPADAAVSIAGARDNVFEAALGADGSGDEGARARSVPVVRVETALERTLRMGPTGDAVRLGIATLWPLAEGERTSLAAPFALVVR
ncbi:MAG: S49 family peptidase [Polyangiaceae bacterium]